MTPPPTSEQSATDDSLPSSSPIESFSEDDEATARVRSQETRETTVASFSTADMWSAVGSAPSGYLFDEHESGPREEGEVDDTAATVRSFSRGEHGGQDGGGEAEDARGRSGRWDAYDFSSKHPHAIRQSGLVTTPRKRSWTGSLTSEEQNRPPRRPRRDEEEHADEERRLPSISELVGNPWGSHGGGRGGRTSFLPPVYESTLRPDQRSPPLNMDYQSNANVSGKAPTPHYTSTVASAVGPHAKGAAAEERAGTFQPRTASRAASRLSEDTHAMDMDAASGYELLRSPELRRARQERDERELAELEERRRDLQAALREADEEDCQNPYPGNQRRWEGGYAPDKMRRGPGRMVDGVPRGKAVDGLRGAREESDHEDGSVQNRGSEWRDSMPPGDRWSAIPNTKAWQFLEQRRAGERNNREDTRGSRYPDQRKSTARGQQEPMNNSTRADERDRSRRATSRMPSEEEQHGGNVNEYEERGELMDHEPAGWSEEVDGGRRTGPGVGGAIPTIVARDEGVADMPVVIEDPHNEKWTVHFEDPETLLRGQSADFVRVIWWESAPTVVFSVFNYKYTDNGAINRHIEAAVTNMTTILTGETGFFVVPPDPEPGRKLQSRELPFAWAIRGLSEAGAWEMVKVRIATSKGVTIMTYPRSLSNPRWVCGLEGFLRPDVASIKKAVLGVLRSEYMIGRLTDLTRSNGDLRHIPEDKRVEHVLRTLEIKMSATGEDAFIANVYIMPPTDDMDAWRDWAEEMRSCRFNSFLCGAGVARRVYWCAGCRGVDHEEYECAIPRMRGWKGPEAGAGSHTKLQIAGASRDNRLDGRGRGCREPAGTFRLWTRLRETGERKHEGYLGNDDERRERREARYVVANDEAMNIKIHEYGMYALA
ncbi:hypothetical protein OH76DRAFT_1486835 [Lentinus brumalis]|uniref:Uncharacterized protein n=1 Tax=Lentinus brumalis TaxID=2498619 RepID=A0A371CX07_9APHY|nr:hypothetical protein OH76DRAFT_1486835 [Polyporus brumalis]